MVTTLLKRERRKPKRLVQRVEGKSSLGYDFALLGLKNRESRVEVIRHAARKTSEKIHELGGNEDERDRLLSELAVSTYRLLDPRRRARSMERVQLSVYGEGDLELQKASRVPILTTQGLVKAQLVS